MFVEVELLSGARQQSFLEAVTESIAKDGELDPGHGLQRVDKGGKDLCCNLYQRVTMEPEKKPLSRCLPSWTCMPRSYSETRRLLRLAGREKSCLKGS